MRLGPVQQKIIEALSDGLPHRAEELLACLTNGYDDEGPKIDTLYVHVCNLNKQLKRLGEEILSQAIHKQTFYRHVRHLRSADE